MTVITVKLCRNCVTSGHSGETVTKLRSQCITHSIVGHSFSASSRNVGTVTQMCRVASQNHHCAQLRRSKGKNDPMGQSRISTRDHLSVLYRLAVFARRISIVFDIRQRILFFSVPSSVPYMNTLHAMEKEISTILSPLRLKQETCQGSREDLCVCFRQDRLVDAMRVRSVDDHTRDYPSTAWRQYQIEPNLTTDQIGRKCANSTSVKIMSSKHEYRYCHDEAWKISRFTCTAEYTYGDEGSDE